MRSGIAAISCCLALSACSTRPPTTDVAQAETTKHAKQVPQSANPFTTFETLQVRPLALSPNGNLLFALNTPDNRLEIFKTSQGNGLPSRGSVAVGLEPVAVAARNENEVWVVNHLSDSVSIVDASTAPRRASCARCSSATSRATSCSRPDDPRVHHHRAPRPEHRATILTICRRRARRRPVAAPTSGCSTPTTSAARRRRLA